MVAGVNTLQTFVSAMARTSWSRRFGVLTGSVGGPSPSGHWEEAECELRTGQLWKTRNNSRELRIQCSDGILWVTQTGDPNDTVLTPGEEFVAKPRALVIVQPLTDARVCIKRARKSA